MKLYVKGSSDIRDALIAARDFKKELQRRCKDLQGVLQYDVGIGWYTTEESSIYTVPVDIDIGRQGYKYGTISFAVRYDIENAEILNVYSSQLKESIYIGGKIKPGCNTINKLNLDWKNIITMIRKEINQLIAKSDKSDRNKLSLDPNDVLLKLLSDAGIDTTLHLYTLLYYRSWGTNGYAQDLTPVRFITYGDWLALWSLQLLDLPTGEELLDFFGEKWFKTDLPRYIRKYPTVDALKRVASSWVDNSDFLIDSLVNNDTHEVLYPT